MAEKTAFKPSKAGLRRRGKRALAEKAGSAGLFRQAERAPIWYPYRGPWMVGVYINILFPRKMTGIFNAATLLGRPL